MAFTCTCLGEGTFIHPCLLTHKYTWAGRGGGGEKKKEKKREKTSSKTAWDNSRVSDQPKLRVRLSQKRKRKKERKLSV